MVSNFSYPRFVQNQLLKSSDLNNLVDYLDSQNRVTRTHLIGVGIAFGLVPVWENSRSRLKISPGAGVTSLGYLIDLNLVAGTDPDQDSDLTARFYKEIKISADKLLCEDNITGDEQDFSMWELGNTSETGVTQPLTKDWLKDKAILLL